jgi:hypothetical protein
VSEATRRHVQAFLSGLGWIVQCDTPGVRVLAQVLEALQRLGWDSDVEAFAPFAEAAEQVVQHERQVVPDFPAASAVACGVLFEVALVALRGLAQEHFFASIYAANANGPAANAPAANAPAVNGSAATGGAVLKANPVNGAPAVPAQRRRPLPRR